MDGKRCCGVTRKNFVYNFAVLSIIEVGNQTCAPWLTQLNGKCDHSATPNSRVVFLYLSY